jgi:hypothetical protein
VRRLVNVILVAISLQLTVIPSTAIADAENNAKWLYWIDKELDGLSRGQPLPGGSYLLLGYRNYHGALVSLLQSTEHQALQQEYQAWAADRRLEVLHRLIAGLSVVPPTSRYAADPGISAFRSDLELALHETSGDDPASLYKAYWICRFLEPSPGIAEKLTAVETEIRAHEAKVRFARDLEAIKARLKDVTARGVSDAELEAKIARLPVAEREDIERLRKQYSDGKAEEVAKARAEQERAEMAARRQKELDQAITWRREEIDTGKTNPVALAQRQSDSGLASAVAQWEQQYRKELAERQAAETKAQPAKQSRVKEPTAVSPTSVPGPPGTAATGDPKVRVDGMWFHVVDDMKKETHEILATLFCGPIERQTCSGDLANNGRRYGKELTDKTMQYFKTATLCESSTWDKAWTASNVGPTPTSQDIRHPDWKTWVKKYRSVRLADPGFVNRCRAYIQCMNAQGYPVILEKNSVEHVKLTRGQ